MKIARRYQMLLLVAVCLGIYYPTVFNTTLSIDDADMVQRMVNGVFRWRDLFSPGGGFYYRPLLILSFWVDLWVWDFHQTFSLLENVLLHAANTVWVFLIADRYLRAPGRSTLLAFCAALLFAIHPLATESINWMSGRTDLMGTFFVLLAVLLLDRALEQGSRVFLLLSMVAFTAGILSKETMLFFLPAALFLMFVRGKDGKECRFSTLWGPMVFYALPFFAGGVGYALYRAAKYGGSSMGLLYLYDRMPYRGLDLLRVVFKVFGFYVKKLFLPLPLNFAIIQVSDYYALLGVLVFLACVWMVRSSVSKWSFVLISFYLIAPAILIALSGVAWTPLAERYVYLSSAFLALGLVAVIRPALKNKRALAAGAVCLMVWISTSAVASVNRSILWQDKEALYADTLKKSPGFAKLRNDYGVALLENGRSDKALAEFHRGQGSKGTGFALVNEARMLLIQGKAEEARAVLLNRYPDKTGMGVRGLKMLTHIEARLLKQADASQRRADIVRELLETHELIYQKTQDPFFLYRSGQLALRVGDKGKAQALFSKAYQYAPPSAHYKAAAKKIADSLEKEVR